MKAKFGAIVVDGRGKIGGHVASKNRAGSYFRTKVSPVNPQTADQLAARNRFTNYSQGWRGLTEAQRAAWNAAVSDFQTTDIFGDLKTPTGLNLYQRLNNNLVGVGVAAISTPPIPSAVGQIAVTAVNAAEGADTLTITMDGAVPAGTYVKVFATSPQSAGKSFVKSEFRQIAVLDPAEATPYNLKAEYVAKFGSIGVEGQKLFVKLVPINGTTGQAGQASQASGIVAA